MLKTLTLKCFRKHEDLTIDFTSGLNVIRGASEAGKSSLLEAVLYALYGGRALRTTLAEAVTWGQPEAKLKVRLDIEAQGRTFTFERSKAGATVYIGDKVHVTGQNEVSAFAAEILGADAKTAAMLMLATQSDLRGSLDEGPTAVSGLIGKLADFDLIDTLLSRAQERLLLGADGPFRARLEAAQADVEAAKGRLVDPAIFPQTQRLLDEAVAALGVAEGVAKILAAEVAAAEESHRAINAEHEQALTIDRQVGHLRATLGSLENQRADLERTVRLRPIAAVLDEAQHRVRGLEGSGLLIQTWKEVQALPAMPETVWEGDADSFSAELARLFTEQEANASAVNVAAQRVKDAQARRIKGDGKCPTCGAVAADHDHVVEHNAALDREIATLQQEHTAAQVRWKATQSELHAMNAVKVSARPFLRDWPAGMPVAVDNSTFPPRVTWTGDTPSDAALVQARKDLDMLRRHEAAALRAEGELAQVVRQIEAGTAEAAGLLASRQRLNLAPLEPLAEAVAAAREKARRAADELAQAQGQVNYFTSTLASYRLQAEQAVAALEAAGLRVSEVQADLDSLARNNALFAKLRKMKPLVTDRLWSLVLTSVSAFFSQMRGEQSVVTKDANGFKVNGYTVDSLSGSTQDILAVAVRVALTKTFIPHASFIVLDEPCHGADEGRTAKTLGFLAGVGFNQTLLATHDQISESVADNVIAMGA